MHWANTWPCLQSRDKLLGWLMVKKVPGALGQVWTWVFMWHLPGHHGNAGRPSSAALTQSKMFWHFQYILYFYYYNFPFKKDLIHTPCVLIWGTTIHQAAGLSTGLSHHCWPGCGGSKDWLYQLSRTSRKGYISTQQVYRVSGSCCFCFLTSGFLKSLCRVAFVLSTDRYNLWFFIASVGPQRINSKSHISIFPQ